MPMVYIQVSLLGKLWGIVDDGDAPGGDCDNVEKLSAEAEKNLKKEAEQKQKSGH